MGVSINKMKKNGYDIYFSFKEKIDINNLVILYCDASWSELTGIFPPQFLNADDEDFFDYLMIWAFPFEYKILEYGDEDPITYRKPVKYEVEVV